MTARVIGYDVPRQSGGAYFKAVSPADVASLGVDKTTSPWASFPGRGGIPMTGGVAYAVTPAVTQAKGSPLLSMGANAPGATLVPVQAVHGSTGAGSDIVTTDIYGNVAVRVSSGSATVELGVFGYYVG